MIFLRTLELRKLTCFSVSYCFFYDAFVEDWAWTQIHHERPDTFDELQYEMFRRLQVVHGHDVSHSRLR